MITIAAEQFTLTPGIRTHVEESFSKLTDLLPKDVSIHFFLSEPAHKVFMVLCKVRIWGKDMVVREEDENLYKAIEAVRFHLTRKIVDEKHRWVRLRRKISHLEQLQSAERRL